jgi:uncharacterized protein involved in response to NO
MPTTAERMRTYHGPAILSYGFRPFFLLGAIWAAFVVAVWLPMLGGRLALPTAFSALEWHVHELAYGYVPSIVAGFLLTAVPNWTGRLPVTGGPLLGLVATWVAGRLAILTSARLGAPLAALVDLLFLACLAGVMAREIVAGRNLRNAKVLVLVALLWVGNAVFHWEAMTGASGGYGLRLGIGVIVFLITLMGGRIIPSFTRNWLVRQPPGRLPTPFGRFDGVCLGAGALAMTCWIARPEARLTAAAAALACCLHTLRLARWAGYRTVAEPLVGVLHVAYAFVPIGFLLLSLGIVAPSIILASGALHGWTVGAIGTMTLAVMTRASLGHTGQALVASWSTQFIYAAILVAATARVLSACQLWQETTLSIAATCWVLAFGGFALSFGPLLSKPRASA